MDAEDVAGGGCFGGSEVWVAVSGPGQVLATRAATIKHLWVDRRQKVDLVRSASSYPFLHRSPGGTSKAQRYRVTRNRQAISVSGRNFTFSSSLSRWLPNLQSTENSNHCSAVVWILALQWFTVQILYCLYCTIIVFRVGTNSMTLNGKPTVILLNSFIKP